MGDHVIISVAKARARLAHGAVFTATGSRASSVSHRWRLSHLRKAPWSFHTGSAHSKLACGSFLLGFSVQHLTLDLSWRLRHRLLHWPRYSLWFRHSMSRKHISFPSLEQSPKHVTLGVGCRHKALPHHPQHQKRTNNKKQTKSEPRHYDKLQRNTAWKALYRFY